MIVTIYDDGGLTMEHSPEDCVVHELTRVLERKEELIQQDMGKKGIAINVISEDGHESLRTL
jgi:hypothetical protein